jgi:hypothetical protein
VCFFAELEEEAQEEEQVLKGKVEFCPLGFHLKAPWKGAALPLEPRRQEERKGCLEKTAH